MPPGEPAPDPVVATADPADPATLAPSAGEFPPPTPDPAAGGDGSAAPDPANSPPPAPEPDPSLDRAEGAPVTAFQPDSSATAAPSSTRTAEPQPAGASVERPSARLLGFVDLSVQSTRGRTVVTVTADGPISIDRVRHSRLTNPPRHLVRVVGAASFSWPYQVEVGDGRVLSVRSAVHPELDPPEVHLVIDRASDGVAVTSVRVSGRVMLVEVE